MKTGTLILAALGLITLLAGCSADSQPAGPGVQPSTPATPASTPANTPATAAVPLEPTATEGGSQPTFAYVESIEILTLESFPVQMTAVVKGSLADPCTTISSATSERDGNAFKIDIVTNREADANCIQVVMPFEQNVRLEVAGLKAGTYTVTAGDVTETFELKVDNVLR